MTAGFWRALRRFWESDRGLSAFLGILVVFLFVLPPLVVEQGRGRGVVVDLGFTALLLAGVAALSTRPAVRAALFAMVVAATAVRWGPFGAEATVAAGLVSVAAMALVVLAQTFRAGPVNFHRIQGAVAAYLLLGLAWALAYELVSPPGRRGLLRHRLRWAREARLRLLQLRHADHRGLRRRDARSPRGALAGRRGSADGTALPGDPARPPRLAGDRAAGLGPAAGASRMREEPASHGAGRLGAPFDGGLAGRSDAGHTRPVEWFHTAQAGQGSPPCGRRFGVSIDRSQAR